MMNTAQAHWYPKTLSHPYFSLSLEKKGRRMHIVMESLTAFIHTKDLPDTYTVLDIHFPEVFQTECFNPLSLPFVEEVKRTEIAHLFEHIILAMMMKLQSKLGNDDVIYDGVTYWNWEKERKGVFHIHISISEKDAIVFSQALKKSIEILEKIYVMFEKKGRGSIQQQIAVVYA